MNSGSLPCKDPGGLDHGFGQFRNFTGTASRQKGYVNALCTHAQVSPCTCRVLINRNLVRHRVAYINGRDTVVLVKNRLKGKQA